MLFKILWFEIQRSNSKWQTPIKISMEYMMLFTSISPMYRGPPASVMNSWKREHLEKVAICRIYILCKIIRKLSLVCKHTRHGTCLQVVLSESKRCNCSNLTLPLVKGYLAIKLQCLHNRLGKFSFVQFGNITCTQNGASNGPNSRESMRKPAETTKPISSKLLAGACGSVVLCIWPEIKGYYFKTSCVED